MKLTYPQRTKSEGNWLPFVHGARLQQPPEILAPISNRAYFPQASDSS